MFWGQILSAILALSVVGSMAKAETTSGSSARRQSREAGKCGPIKDTENLMAMNTQTAMVCAPATLTAGVHLLKGVPAMKVLANGAKALGKKAAVRGALVFVGGAGVVLTAADLVSMAMNQIGPSECDLDNNFKRKVLGRSNTISKDLVKASEGLIDPVDARFMMFPPAYLKDSYLKKVTCAKLANMVRLKQQRQQQEWARMLTKTRPRGSNAREYAAKIKRIKQKRIAGFHAGHELPMPQFQSLKQLAKKASCLSPRVALEVACAMGDLALIGKMPSQKDVNNWMKGLSPKDRLPTKGLAVGKIRDPEIAALIKKPTKDMTPAERQKLLSYTMSPDLPDSERLALAQHSLGRSLKDGEAKSILDVHYLCQGGGDCIERKGLALRAAGFNAPEIRGLIDNGITGLAGNALNGRGAGHLMREAGVSEYDIQRYFGSRADNLTLENMDNSQKGHFFDYLIGNAKRQAASGSIKDAKRSLAMSHETAISRIDSHMKNGTVPHLVNATLPDAFATRNAFDLNNVRRSGNDRLAEIAAQSGYFDGIGKVGVKEYFDPLTRTNLSRFSMDGVRGNLALEEAYINTNKHFQELRAIVSLRSLHPSNRPPGTPAFIDDVDSQTYQKWLNAYRDQLLALERAIGK